MGPGSIHTIDGQPQKDLPTSPADGDTAPTARDHATYSARAARWARKRAPSCRVLAALTVSGASPAGGGGSPPWDTDGQMAPPKLLRHGRERPCHGSLVQRRDTQVPLVLGPQR